LQETISISDLNQKMEERRAEVKKKKSKKRALKSKNIWTH
jgi:hypothetical protein